MQKIIGVQRDFSYGEVDTSLKRADDHPARKAGLRQMANARILNSGSVQDRPGRRALFPIQNNCTRWEEFTISPGNVFKIGFGPGRLHIVNSSGQLVANFIAQGNTAALPWTANNLNLVDYAILGLSIYVTFPSMRPQVVTWNGISTWSIADYNELAISGQKRTIFYRISPQGIAIQPAAQVGSGINVVVSGSVAVFTPQHVGTRIRFVGRQILITAFVSPSIVTTTIEEPLPGSQSVQFLNDPARVFSPGDIVIGSVSGAKGQIFSVPGGNTINIQLLSLDTTTVTSQPSFQNLVTTGSLTTTSTVAFLPTETIVGPGGSLAANSVSGTGAPFPSTIWDEEVMNNLRGFPASCFVDQFRLGFCNFPSLPNGIAWSSINAPTDLYVGANPSDAMFEIAPNKMQIYYVVAGPESSEFVFCDRGIYYIPISPANPLKPGSVSFQVISGDGSAQVKPRLSQEAILYVNAGQNSVMAVIATGAYYRPFNSKNLSEFHAHLFNSITAIAAPSADGTFNERYVYVLNGDGSMAVGKYDPSTLMANIPVIGWGPWTNVATVTWIGAYASDVIFASNYFGTMICEVLDDSQYLDCALPVNAAPAVMAPPGGKGPLWFIPSQSVTLIDQGTRIMGTYQIDANGFIIPQFNGGEDLTVSTLVAGEPWTMTVEPFCPDAPPGNDAGQRMFKRRVSRFAAYVIHSTGFVFARLFAGPVTPTSPALGTIIAERRVTAWNQDDDATKPPPQREEAQRWRPLGFAYDPRIALIKDTPGPLLSAELGMEITI